MEEFPGRSNMLAYLEKNGIGHQIVSQAKKRYSTDANLCGLSNEAEDLESIQTAMTIVNPVMGVWPKDAPNEQEDLTLRFVNGRCTHVDYYADPTAVDPTLREQRISVTLPLAIMNILNKIAGRNGIGISHAIEPYRDSYACP